ncbi:MAG TPA: SAM-dependent methyltransferase [Burkholderiales bacterium]|nr:SAM-dependent methyltransferase [Burkholderiales bacterium]
MVETSKLGTLYLAPVPLGDSGIEFALPPAARTLISGLEHFVVENPKTARHFLKQIGSEIALQLIKMEVLDEHTKADQLNSLLKPLLDGKDIGLMSEAGCPGIADPGSALVALAHARGIPVRPLVGPSSILLALIASGLNGQSFAFHGYLPADKIGRMKRITELEKESSRQKQTQIFIETPYRNNALLVDLLAVLNPRTRLCIAVDLTVATESVCMQTITNWRKSPPDLNKRPAVFLILA